MNKINTLLDNYFSAKDGSIDTLRDIFQIYANSQDFNALYELIMDYSRGIFLLNPEIELPLETIKKIQDLKNFTSIVTEYENTMLSGNYSGIIEKYFTHAEEEIIGVNKLEVRNKYNKYYEKIGKTKPLDFIIFYEAPPEDMDNYILNNPKNSHYANVLKKYFDSNDANIETLLINKHCLFVDILDIPIKLDKEKYPYIRLFWSLLNPPFTYLLFRKKIEKLVNDGLIGMETKVAIGMPPNSSLGIYNYLPLDRQFYIDNNIHDFYKKLVKGNEELNISTTKILNYPKQRFNSHKSNVSIGQNPSLELLQHAWK
jgi:hypothetical protein